MPTDTEIVGSTNTNINVGENGKAKDQKNSKTMEEVAKENKRLIISIRSMEEAIETLNQVNSPSITSSPTSSASEESTSSSTKASLKKSLPSSALSGVTKPTEQSEKKVNAFLEQGRKKKEAKQNAKEQSKFAKESAKDTNAMVKDYARTLSSKEQLELEIRTTIDPRVGMDKKTTEAAEYLLKESLATSKLTATTCWKKEAHSHDHHGLDFPKKANLESSKATEDDEGEGDGDGKNTRHSP